MSSSIQRSFLAVIALVSLTAGSSAFAEGGATVPPIETPPWSRNAAPAIWPTPRRCCPSAPGRRSWAISPIISARRRPVRARASDDRSLFVAHAGDAPGATQGHRFMRGIPADATPLRITDTRFWIRGHSDISAAGFASPNVKSKANCVACHRSAAAGQYGEEE